MRWYPSADLYAYFFERGIKLLKPGGRLGYISSSTFFKTGSGEPLRRYLRTHAQFEHIVDFGDHQIFEGVTTYPAILTMRAGAPAGGHEFHFWKIDELPKDSFADDYADAAQVFPQSALTNGSWELENPALRALRAKIVADKPTLKEVYGSPLYGIKTGLNEAFVIDTPTKDRLCAQDPNSAELLKPFLEGKDLKRWRAEPRGLWIIYIPKNRIKIDAYPAIRDWLLPFKDKLEKRATKQEWFELQQAQDRYEGYFLKGGLIYPDISQGMKFLKIGTGNLIDCTTFIVPKGDEFLTALVNSDPYWFLLLSIANPLRGGTWRLRLKAQYVEPLPIPLATDTQKQALADLAAAAQGAAERRYALQQSVTRRIADLAPDPSQAKLTTALKSWWTLPEFAAFQREVKKAFKADIPLKERNDWEEYLSESRPEIHMLTAQIAAIEADINARVYELFDLTPDEIALLEANI